MPRKDEFLSQLLSSKTQEIVSSPGEYTAFLQTAARNYKYGFQEQVLIHAQRPDATACAEIGVWNRLGRWVNRGSTGIALLQGPNLPYRIRYVFDVSDTNSRENREISLWQMKPEYESEVMDTLQSRFQYDFDGPFGNCIEVLSQQLAEEVVEAHLNALYDSFAEKYGRINSRANSTAFSSDNAYYLLSSLEVRDSEGNFLRKADMFSKRTIRQKISVTSVDTASEALALSLAEKAKVDMPYMMELTHKSEEEILSDLKGVIFLNPEHDGNEDVAHKYLPADEYLSGNVREKLRTARAFAETDERYSVNVQSLEAVQPVDLTASEISVRLGAAWLPTEVVRDFTFELLRTPYYQRRNIKVHYSTYTGEWNIDGKSLSTDQQKRYLEKYRLPERFFRSRDGIESVPYKPQNRER